MRKTEETIEVQVRADARVLAEKALTKKVWEANSDLEYFRTRVEKAVTELLLKREIDWFIEDREHNVIIRQLIYDRLQVAADDNHAATVLLAEILDKKIPVLNEQEANRWMNDMKYRDDYEWPSGHEGMTEEEYDQVVLRRKRGY